MIVEPRYVIDSCSLITLRRLYPIDVFPGVWLKVGELAQEGILISVEDVYEELRVSDDEVSAWARSHLEIFHELAPDVQDAARILASHPKIVDVKKRKSSADPFVIALARTRSCTVVTEERPSNNNGKPKIPDVCKAYGVPCVPLLQMLRIENLRL